MNQKEKKIIEMLPGDLHRIAELIGIDNTIILIQNFGGGYLIIGKCESIIKDIRNNKIRELYDDKDNPITIRELAWKFNLSNKTIQTILKKVDKDIPLPLLELL